MPFVVATEAHAIPERPPLSLASGDVVTVGRRDADWPAFVFVTTAEGSGWVPSRYLSADAGRAVVEMPYNTTELATRSGEILEVIAHDDESGWLWCRSTDGREGWVPSRSVEAAPEPESRSSEAADRRDASPVASVTDGMSVFSSPPGGEDAGAADPVSWLQIESGWSVVGSDGELVGSVVSVAGDKHEDIFDGLAVDLGGSAPPRYVPGERVGLIFPGKVTVQFSGSEARELELFEAPKAVTVWRPSAPSLTNRLTNWMRGKR